ncbi:MAG: hypothetical protein JWO95_3009 [Verrucomicrobiales bacterium]|nr:hypothetical protein [Verrucomicrobiales bacterium]
MRHAVFILGLKAAIVRVLALTVFTAAASAQIDPDLPGSPANLEIVSAGSLVIPMDNSLQALSGTPFNLKAYGLVNALLHSNIPVKWVIATGKSKDAIDFTASAAQIVPTAGSTNIYNFRAGPFVIESVYTNLAMPIISAWSNNVAVYRLTADSTMDVHYTLAHKPKVAVMADGAFHGIQTNVLAEAGFPTTDYQVLYATNLPLLTVTSCFTIVTAPHYDGGTNANAQTFAIRGFLASGGNVLCQCAAVTTYENNVLYGDFHTSAGITVLNAAGTCSFANSDCAFGQFEGGVTNLTFTSAVANWGLVKNSAFTNNAYTAVYISGQTTNQPYAAVSKLRRGQTGSCMFYLGGHDYGVQSSLDYYNGRRMMLNAIFVPADRPSECGVNFRTDLGVLQDNSVRSFTNGQLVTYTITVTNHGGARVIGAPFYDSFATALTNVTWSAAFLGNSSGNTTNGVGNISALLNLPPHSSAVFTATGRLIKAADCTITNTATVSPPASILDANLADNTSIHVDNVNTTVRVVDALTCLGSSAAFAANTTGSGPFRFVWKLNGATLASTPPTLTITNVTPADAGTYSVEVTSACGSATNSAVLFIGDLMTATPLMNVVACGNQAVTFATSISNFPTASYIWRKNGTALNGATNSSLTFVVANTADAGTYSVEISNGCITLTNFGTVSMPSIAATAMFGLTRCIGQTASFNTIASGNGPFSFVWRKDGTQIPGATNNSISVPITSLTNAGLYSVEVSGACSAVTNSATLTVRSNVAVGPLGTQFCCPGQSAAFKATPTGTAPFSYRWRKNGIVISGQSTSNLVLNAVTSNDAGTYSVEVTGSCNTATNTGILVVGGGTLTATPLLDQTHCPTETATFATTVIGGGPVIFAWRRDGQLIGGETNNTVSIANLPIGMPPTTISVEVHGVCSSVTNSATLRVEDYINVTNSMTFTNSSPIAIVDNQPAGPYPSTIHVSCIFPNDVARVQVGLLGFSHTYPSDVCILLQSPSGKTTPLMIDAGGGRDFPVQNVNLLFDDGAADLPFNAPLTSGTFAPGVYGPTIDFPVPAPAYGQIGLGQFTHENAHGDWKLFVYDDRIIDSGSIANGWTLTLFVADAHAPYFITPHCDQSGAFCTTLVGDANCLHVIEASADLSNWTPVATNTLPDGTFVFTNAAPSTLLFYRAVRWHNIDP